MCGARGATTIIITIILTLSRWFLSFFSVVAFIQGPRARVKGLGRFPPFSFSFRRRRPVASLRSLFIFTLYRFCLTTHAGMRGSPVLYHHDRSEDLTQTSRHYLSLTNFPGQRLPMNYCYWSYPLTAIFETLKQPKNLNYGFQNTPNL